MVNNVTYHGTLKASQVFLDICKSIEEPPKHCRDYLQDEELIYVERDTPSQAYDILLISLFILAVLAVFSFVLVVFYRTYARRKLLS